MNTNQINIAMKVKKILFLIIGISIISVSCKNKIEEVRKLTAHSEQPPYVTENINVFHSDSGHVIFQLKAPLMIQYQTKEKNYTVFPKGVIAKHFYPEYPSEDSYIKADYAKYLPKDNIWEAHGNVIAQNRKGEKLFAEEIFWNMKEEKIFSNKNIKIQTEDEIIYGTGFEADQYFEHYTIKKIRGTVYINEDSTQTDTL